MSDAKQKRAKIVSLGHLIQGDAPITFEIVGGGRHTFIISEAQMRLINRMTQLALDTAELPGQERQQALVRNLFAVPAKELKDKEEKA